MQTTKDTDTITAGEIMTTTLLTVPQVMTVRELSTFLADHEITGAPVTDENGNLVGVVSVTDIAQNEANQDSLVRNIMTPTVYTVPADTPVRKIARAMIAGRVHRLVVTQGDDVVGIVTSLDLLKLLSR